MSTKRENILKAVGTIISGIKSEGKTVFKTVTVAKIPPVELETVAFPACFIYSGGETKLVEGNSAVVGSETWDWNIILEVWAMDIQMETLLNLIHSAMFADYKLDNNAEWSERIGVDFMVVDPTRQIEAMFITYRVLYRHLLGDMSS